MIYFYVQMMEHDKWFKNHHKEEKRFKTLKEASIYATQQKYNFWKVGIVRIDTKNLMNFRIYNEVSHGKWKRIL